VHHSSPRLALHARLSCRRAVRRDAYVVELARVVESVDIMSAMLRYPSGSELYEALKAEGFTLPDECADVRMVMPIDGVFQLHYIINLRDDDLVKWGRALQRLGTVGAEPVKVRQAVPVDGCVCPICEAIRDQQRRMDMESQPPSLDELKPLPSGVQEGESE